MRTSAAPSRPPVVSAVTRRVCWRVGAGESSWRLEWRVDADVAVAVREGAGELCRAAATLIEDRASGMVHARSADGSFEASWDAHTGAVVYARTGLLTSLGAVGGTYEIEGISPS